MPILPVVLDGTTGLMRGKLRLNWRNTITIRILPPIEAERVQNTDTKELMAGVRDDMVAALAEIREEKKR